MTHTPTLVEVVCRLPPLLDAIGDALRDGRTETLLATESELGRTLQALSTFEPADATPDILASLRAPVDRSRAALARCRRLGASLEHLAEVTLVADERTGAYTRAGHAAVVAPAGALRTRG